MPTGPQKQQIENIQGKEDGQASTEDKKTGRTIPESILSQTVQKTQGLDQENENGKVDQEWMRRLAAGAEGTEVCVRPSEKPNIPDGAPPK